MMLVRSSNSDKLSNRIVHVSVQLFSNKDLALAMTEQLSLLHIMVSSLKNMMNDVLISSGLHHDSEENKHKVYWNEVDIKTTMFQYPVSPLTIIKDIPILG